MENKILHSGPVKYDMYKIDRRRDGKNARLKNTITYTFDSYYDFIDSHKAHTYPGAMIHDNDDTEFYNSKNLQEALELAEKGWKIGLEEFSAKVEKIKQAILQDVTEQDYYYDVTGQFLDIDKHIQGQPECWLDMQDAKPKKALDIYVNCTFHCGITSNVIFNRGAAIAALVDLLSKDYSIDLYVTAALYNRSTDVIISRVKLPTDPLDLDTITFALAHSSFFRRFATAIYDLHYKRNCAGPSRPVDDPEIEQKNEQNDKMLYFEMPLTNEIYFNTVEDAGEWAADFYLKRFYDEPGQAQEGGEDE